MTQKERQERSKREILRAAREEFGASSYEKSPWRGYAPGTAFQRA